VTELKVQLAAPQALQDRQEVATRVPAPYSAEPAVEPTEPSVFDLEAVGLWYGHKQALADITMSFPVNRVTALIGPSGCGKSTLIRCLNRMNDLIPNVRLSGSVKYHGQDIYADGIDPVEVRRRVGMVFQKPNPFPLSIWKNITLPLKQHGMRDRHTLQATAEGALRDVGLWDEVKDRLSAPALALSGGQQQRLCIARALALKPQVVLFDEPCSALDPLSSQTVEDLIAGLRSRYTVLIVTHNLAQARRIADDVGVFWVVDGVGRLIEHGRSAQIFEAPAHPQTAAYLRGKSG
jgi:phosphate transport system ATP-binding protein